MGQMVTTRVREVIGGLTQANVSLHGVCYAIQLDRDMFADKAEKDARDEQINAIQAVCRIIEKIRSDYQSGVEQARKPEKPYKSRTRR